MSDQAKDALKKLEKINIKKYQNYKIRDSLTLFNSVLILDILIICVSIGIIIAHYLIR
ncbi:hypothetical protein MCAV_00350 [[Mycoplasma] cavipharyngis]|uniref:hypothetical protein n=1 Tax=[Mycoplasma] cavipharyngis TaxID=92757 RepID=UPI003703C995